MKKFEKYPENFLNGFGIDAATDVGAAIEILESGEYPLGDRLRMCAEKYIMDNNEETVSVPKDNNEEFIVNWRLENNVTRNKYGINKKYKFKNRQKAITHRNYKPVFRLEGGKTRPKDWTGWEENIVAGINKGNLGSWHKEWRKIDKRMRRHEGKNLCHDYVAEDITIDDDFYYIPEALDEYDDWWYWDNESQCFDPYDLIREGREAQQNEWMSYMDNIRDYAYYFLQENNLLEKFDEWLKNKMSLIPDWDELSDWEV